MKNRIEQLDSFRGLGALSVLISHAIPLLAIPIAADKLLKATGVLNGHGFLMLFFVLSGFVLSLPFLKKDQINYTSYLIRRLCRIYVPYIIAITFAIILSQIFLSYKIGSVSGYIDSQWKTILSGKLIMEHIYFIGNIHADSFNGVIWTLIHELRIALIFPFVVLIIKRIDWKVSVLICIALTSVKALDIVFHLEKSNGFHISYIDTLSYLSLFIMGVLLAKHRTEAIGFFQKLKRINKIIFLLISILLFNFSGLAIFDLYELTKISAFTKFALIMQEYGMGIGAIGFFIIAIGSSKAENVLMFKPINFVGKISFSLYLYHPLVLLSCIHLFYYTLPFWSIFIITIVFSILVGYITWKFIEVPSMRLGKTIANRVSTIQGSKIKPQQMMTKNQ